jgi:hypothetical protein
MSIAGGAVSLILAMCCCIAARPALGVLVGFILLCITVPAPFLWSYLCKLHFLRKANYTNVERVRDFLA